MVYAYKVLQGVCQRRMFFINKNLSDALSSFATNRLQVLRLDVVNFSECFFEATVCEFSELNKLDELAARDGIASAYTNG